MKEVFDVMVKEVDEARFYYVDFGAEDHGRVTFRLWIHPSFVKKRDDGRGWFIEMPMSGVTLVQGKSPKTWILRPGENNLFHVFVRCGYRGDAGFEIRSPVTAVVKYHVYRSPRGRLGVSEGALVATKENYIKYQWSRSGRLYGASPTGNTVIELDGSRHEFEDVDTCEIEDLADLAET